MIIDQGTFYEGYRKNFGRISEEQLQDLDFFINKLDHSSKITGATWEITRRKYCYVLATVFHETAGTFDPISEMGSRRYLMSKPYYPFYGRGYVQLTWKWNYINFGNFLGIDLVNQPWLANEPENAWLILEEGMTRNADVKREYDPNFTAYTLEDCYNEERMDDVLARRIINGKDRAQYIAGIARQFASFVNLKEAV